jgi:thiamine-monophosphate kinase
MPRSKKTSEKELLEGFARTIAAGKSKTPGIVLGVGDDTAVLRPKPYEDLLVTTDILVEGRHFKQRWFTGAALGWRLAAVNLSDIASLGGRPLYGLLSFALPRGFDERYIHAVERGVRDHLAVYGASIVGGNVSGIESTLVCDLTLIGSCARGKAWRRTCRPGRDVILVAGYLGDARAGLALLERSRAAKRPSSRLVRAFKKPVPRLDVAKLFRGNAAIHGAIDVSDGLSTDLIHMCEANGAGCEIDTGRLPLSRALRSHCAGKGVDPVEFALAGGEDYALLLAVDAKKAEAVAARIERALGIPASVIGRFTKKKNTYHVIDDDGSRCHFKSAGWDHLSPGS